MERRLLWLNVGAKALVVATVVRRRRPLPQLADSGLFAFALALQRTSLGNRPAWSIAVGFGAATEILWELGEYTVMKLGSSGLQLTYEDTIGDLALGGAGTLLGATLVAVAFRPGVVRGSAPAS